MMSAVAVAAASVAAVSVAVLAAAAAATQAANVTGRPHRVRVRAATTSNDNDRRHTVITNTVRLRLCYVVVFRKRFLAISLRHIVDSCCARFRRVAKIGNGHRLLQPALLRCPRNDRMFRRSSAVRCSRIDGHGQNETRRHAGQGGRR